MFNNDTLTATSMNRRSLLKRAGILGLSIPTAGALLSACGGTQNVDPRIAAAAKPTQEPVAGAPAANIASDTVTEITVVGKDIFFEPTTLEVPSGGLVRLTFVNEGVMEHDWVAPDFQVTDFEIIDAPASMTARMEQELDNAIAGSYPYAGGGANESMTVEFVAGAAGTYEFLCIVPGHAVAGMVGTLTVTGEGGVAAAEDHEGHEDGHVVSTPATGGTPYDAPQMPNPVVAPPVTHREPMHHVWSMDIVELEAYVDKGIAFKFWTFDGTVPGPMLRARVGDTIELTLNNPADSHATHNIDLHSVTGQGGGAEATLIAPGESATFKFKALNPGAFVYHCATDPIPQHISAGMYGLMVVEPEEGLPPVDREFYVMQGDLYLEGARGEQGLRDFSFDKMLDERPDYVTFNGSVGAIAGERAFKAKVGETIRIFFGVGGPNLVSSFHVIGEIFDRVMVEGATEWNTNIQTTLVPAGGATVVDFKVEVPSTLMMVDHSLGRLYKGAVGMIEVEGDENPEVFEEIAHSGR